MVPKDWGRRVYDFSFINPAFGGLIITPRICEVIFRDGRQQIAPIHWQHISGMCEGTTRPLFGCPCCSHHTSSSTTHLASCIATNAPSPAASATPRSKSHAKGLNTYKANACAAFSANIPAALQSTHAPQDLQRTSSQTAPDRSQAEKPKVQEQTPHRAYAKANQYVPSPTCSGGERINACPGFTARAGA
jgi:hypothetical protein